MSEQTLKFGDIVVNKKECHALIIFFISNSFNSICYF